MIDPVYPATVTVGGSDSSYKTGSFPRPTQSTGGRSGLLANQSLIWQITLQDETKAAQFDISGATATMYVSATSDPDYTPVLLASGALSDSGSFGGGTTDRVTFTVAKNGIPNDLGAYGKANGGNATFYCILEDGDSFLEFYEQVNVYDTQFGGQGGNNPALIQTRKNNLGVVIDTLDTPPGSPATNDAYLIGTSPTGDWTGQANNLAIWNGAAWIFTTPQDGDFLYDQDEDAQKRFTTVWSTEDAKPFSDDSPLINNSVDTTKQVTFSAASLTTATTRTITAADQDVDMTPGTGTYEQKISGAALTSATVAATDKILGQDVSDSDNLKTYTAQSIANQVNQLNNTLDSNSQQIRWSKGADVASAASLTLGTDGNYFDITGTTTITSIGSLAIGTVVKLHFDGALTLTHNATDLILPGAANITTAAGDEAEFIEYASGDWRCTAYQVAANSPGGGGAGSGFPDTDNDKTAAYTVVSGDVGENIVFSGLSADVDCTLDVSLLSLGDILGVINEDSTYSVRVVVSNTSTMTLGSTKTDQYLWQGETVLFGGDTSTNARFLARP
tara:strand:+ start:149 stop:1831 length:1683 start_codon:yes stop_codon:yes gene_type:complete